MPRLIISQRDIDCLSFLHAHKVATAKQIHREIFKNAKTNFYKKVRLYEKIKLVNRVTGAKDFDLSGVYELTKKGFNIVRANQKGLTTHNRYKSSSSYHDLFLVEIRHIMRQRRIVTNYLTENQIQTRADFDTENSLVDFKRSHCDALAVLKNPANGVFLKVAIEFELSDKSMKDYRKKLADYYNSEGIHAVFYICYDRATELRIKKSELEIYKGNKNKIHYLLYEKLQDTDKPVTFYAQNGSSITV